MNAETLMRRREAERSTLGAILLDNGALDRAVSNVDPEDFRDAHRRILLAMVALNERGVAIDTVTVKDELLQRGDLERVGGPAYIASLLDGVPYSANVEHYARIVKDCADRENAAARAQQVIEDYESNGGSPNGPPAEIDAQPSDLGNALRLVARHGAELRYVIRRGVWIAWDRSRWKEDEGGEVYRRAKETVLDLYHRAPEAADKRAQKEQAAHALASQGASRIAAMVKLAESEPGIPIAPEDLDKDALLFNVSNGTLDLRTGELRAPSRRDLITKMAGAAYDPAATCPTWEAFLERIMAGNADLIDFLRRSVGYSLTGETKEQVLFLLHGSGANGKSTFLRVLLDILGDYGRQARSEVLLLRQRDEHPNEIARLRGARFVSVIEVDEGRRLAEGLVKQLTGGDRVAARHLYQECFEFDPEFKLFLAVNHLPVVRGTDLAIWRRIRLIPFNITVPLEEQDRELPEKLRAELPGILRWAVEGCREWRRIGLTPPNEVALATEGYRAGMDTLSAFLDEECVLGPDYSVGKSGLYEAYTRWAQANGESPVTHKAFSLRLFERGFTDRRGAAGVRLWNGVGLASKEVE